MKQIARRWTLGAAALAASASVRGEVDLTAFAGRRQTALAAQERMLADASRETVAELGEALLSHPDARVRLWAAETLAAITETHPRLAFPAREILRRAQMDASEAVRFAAARGLARAGDASGEQTLAAALGEPSRLRAGLAADALARVGGADAVPGFIALLSSSDRALTARAFRALAAITGQRFGHDVFLSPPVGDPSSERMTALAAEIQDAENRLDGAVNIAEKERLKETIAALRRQRAILSAQAIAHARETSERARADASLRWKQWFAENKEGRPRDWLLAAIDGDDAIAARAAAERLARFAEPPDVPDLLRRADETTRALDVRRAILAAAEAHLTAEHVPAWIDFLGRQAARVGGGAPDAKPTAEETDVFALVQAAAEGLSRRTGLPPSPEARTWGVWWDKASRLPPDEALGATFYVAGDAPDDLTAVILPDGGAREDPVAAVVASWDAAAGSWRRSGASVPLGAPLPRDAATAEVVLADCAIDPETGRPVWTFTVNGRERTLLAR